MKSVKNTITLLLLTLLFAQCTDEHLCEMEKEPAPCRAECGVVTAKKIINPDDFNDIPTSAKSDLQYTIKISNECTGNSKKFVLSSEAWSSINVGETLCADNVEIW